MRKYIHLISALIIVASIAIPFVPRPVHAFDWTILFPFLKPPQVEPEEEIPSYLSPYSHGDEIVELRTDNSKAFWVYGDRFVADIYSGSIHYRDNYYDSNEPWKEIDLTWENNQITKAPYTLTVDTNNYSITMYDKRSNSTTTLSLESIGDYSVPKVTPSISPGKISFKNVATDTDLEIVALNDLVYFRRVLRSSNAPTDAKFNISQSGNGIGVETKARYVGGLADRSLVVESSKIDNLITENIDREQIKQYPIEVDPILYTQGSASDGSIYSGNANYATAQSAASGTARANTDAVFYLQNSKSGATYFVERGFLYFDTSSIGATSTVNSAYISVVENGSGVQNDAGQATLHVVEGVQSDPYIVTDFGDELVKTTSGGSTAFSGGATSNITLNATGRSWIDQSGTSLFCLRLDGDINASSPTNLNLWYVISQNDGTASNRPHLYVDYTLAAEASLTADPATSVEETTATLTGNITDIGSSNATMRGFAWGATSNATQPGNEEPPASYTSNWTEDGNFGVGQFTHGITGLSSATCYYFRAYAYNNNGYGWSSNEESFLTKPDAPTNLSCSGANTTVNLTWTAASCGAGNTCNTYIRYQAGSYPANVTDGTESYNGTGVSTSQGGLTNGVAYYFRAWTWVTGCGESKYSDNYDECNATPQALVVVDTLDASLVEENDAQLTANITDLAGAANADMRGFAWGSTCNSTTPGNETPPSSYTSNWTEGGAFAVGSFSHNITGLSEGTCYCYRGYAHTATGYGWGDEVSFLTKPDEPNTLACAAGDGQVTLTWTKGSGADNTYIRYKAGAYPDNITDGTLSYNGTGITTTQGGLANGTAYYFRAWSWSVGCTGNLDVYSDLYDECNATPAASTVSVRTLPFSGINSEWAIVNGEVLDLGGGTSITTRGFDYGLTTAYGESSTETGTYGLSTFVLTLTDLEPATVYHYRAKAQNNNGVWGYGEDRLFATKGSPVPYEFWNTGGDGDSVWIYGANWTYQTFTTNTTDVPHSITSIKLSMRRVGYPGDVTVSVRHSSNCTASPTCYCYPTGADIVTSTLDGDTFETSYTWYEFEFTEDCFSANTTYAIVVRAIGGDTSNYVQWQWDSGGGYTGGNAGHSADSGVTWSDDCPADYLFEVWGNPCLEVLDAKVFTSYIEDGDWLITCLYKNIFPPYYEEAEDISTLFYLQLVDGSTVEAQSRVFDWGYRPGCIYLNADEVESLELGADYYVRMWGNFGDNPYMEYALTGADWMGSDLHRLDSWVRSTVSLMESYYGIALTEYIQGKGIVLNEDGGVIFANNIPELDAVRPGIFEIVSEVVGWTQGEFTHAYQSELAWETLLGPQIADIFGAMGDAFGLEGSTFGAVIGFAIYAVVALLAFPPGHAIAAIVLPSPILLFVWGTGLAELALMGICLAVAIILFVWQFWFKGA